MVARVLLDRDIEKDLRKLPRRISDKFFKVIDRLKDDPLMGIPLKGRLEGSRKIRLGDYRIVYQFSPKIQKIIVYRIESRQGVYKK